jgi:hypothetical protein
VELIELPRLHQLLNYDTETGLFRWRIRKGGTANPGVIAGCADPRGYVRIKLDGRYYYAHRLVWFWVHQYWPDQLDHVDGDPSNNAISNLREATSSENNFNSRVRSDSGTKIKGVWSHGVKFTVVIQANGLRKYYGIFDTLDEAKLAASLVRCMVHGKFAREA